MTYRHRLGLPRSGLASFVLLCSHFGFIFCIFLSTLTFKPRPAHAFLPLLIGSLAMSAARQIGSKMVIYAATSSGTYAVRANLGKMAGFAAGTAGFMAVESLFSNGMSAPVTGNLGFGFTNAYSLSLASSLVNQRSYSDTTPVSLSGYNSASSALQAAVTILQNGHNCFPASNWVSDNATYVKCGGGYATSGNKPNATIILNPPARMIDQMMQWLMNHQIYATNDPNELRNASSILSWLNGVSAADAVTLGIDAVRLNAGDVVSIPDAFGNVVNYTVDAVGNLIAAAGSGAANLLNTQTPPPFTPDPAVVAQASADASAAQTAADQAASAAVGHPNAQTAAQAAQTAATDANAQASAVAAATSQAAVDAALAQLSTDLATAQQSLTDVQSIVAQDLATVQAITDTYTMAANNAQLTASSLSSNVALYPSVSTYSQAATSAASSAVSALSGFSGVVDPAVAQTVAAQVQGFVDTVTTQNNQAQTTMAAVDAAKVQQSNVVQSSLQMQSAKARNNASVGAPLAYTPKATPQVQSYTPAPPVPAVASPTVTPPSNVTATGAATAANQQAQIQANATNTNAIIAAVDAVAPAVGAQMDQRRADDASAVHAQINATRQADQVNMPSTGHYMTVSEFIARLKMSPFGSSIVNGLSWTDNAGYPVWTFDLRTGPVIGVFTINTADYAAVFSVVSAMMVVFGGLFAWRIVLG